MFGPGPTEEINVEAKQARMEQPADPHDSQAQYEAKLDRDRAAAEEGHGPGPLERLKRWFSDRF